MRALILTATMLLSASIAAAQGVASEQDETALEEVPEIRRYTVEVIIFEYAENVSLGSEVFVPDEPPVEAMPEPADVLVFEDTAPEPAPEEEPLIVEEDPAGPEFILHLEDEFTMGSIASRLEQLDVYEPIMHFAWTQVTLPQEDTLAIDLHALSEPPERLAGSFTLYLSRYLHLVVDLTLDAVTANGEPVAIDDSPFVFSDSRTGFGYDDLQSPPVRFRIQEDRIFKNGDLRYFDHPKFGVLAKITRVEEAAPDEVEPEMLGDDPRDIVGGLRQ